MGDETDSTAPAGVPVDSDVSVVIATWNDERHLGDSIASVASQTLLPAAIVVCDDASTDGTKGLVDRLRPTLPVPLVYVRNQANLGVAGAKSRGIAEATTPWVAICDSDDLWEPDKLRRQMEFIRAWDGERRLVVLGTAGWNMAADGRRLGAFDMGCHSVEDFDRRQGSFMLLVPSHTSVVFDRQVFEEVGGYPEDYIGVEDSALWALMADHGVILNLPDRLVSYRKRPGSVQSTRFREQEEALYRLQLNLRRRASGEAPLGEAEVAEILRARTRRRRLKRWRRTTGKFYYRLGSTHVVNRQRVRGGLELAAAALCDPLRVLNGIRARKADETSH